MTDEVIVSADQVTEASPQAQKALTVEQVNEIVRREKAQALERGRKEAQAQYEKELEQYRASNPSMGGMGQAVDEEKVYQNVMSRFEAEQAKKREEDEQSALRADADRLAGQYVEKMAVGPTLYEDFEKVTSEFNPTAFPQIVFLAANLDNTAEVMYDLAKNPQKLMTIDYLAQRDPKSAYANLQRLSESIKSNQLAKESNPQSMAPLTRIQPSVTAGADSGKLSIEDYKRMPWLRV